MSINININTGQPTAMKPQREHRSISWGRLLRQDNWVLTEFTP